MKMGSRWRSRVCGAEVVVVRPPSVPGEMTCGGAPMVPFDGPAEGRLTTGVPARTLVGKRYQDPETGLEMLCTKSGEGVLAFDGRELSVREAKRLPSSD